MNPYLKQCLGQMATDPESAWKNQDLSTEIYHAPIEIRAVKFRNFHPQGIAQFPILA